MHPSQILLRLGASIVCAAGVANAAYAIGDSFDSSNFFSEFSFFTAADPTAGYVEFASAVSANTSGLAGYSNGAVYLGVDHTTTNPTGGRGSVRVTSNKAYTHGLFVADIAHMPGGICGVWPAFWTFGPNWPASGEIDIIEGVNQQTTDSITLHTSSGCTMSSSGSLSSSSLGQTDCNAGNGDDGCGFSTAGTQGYGAGFNAIGGGVYAMEWTSSAIEVYFFPRTSIPSDITSGNPDPSTWGTPVASFSGSGCDIDTHFANHNIIFDTTFCGQWAGNVWSAPFPTSTSSNLINSRSSGSCASLASTCDAYVAANPSAFTDAYWMVNSVKVYQDGTTAKRNGVTPVPFMA